MPDLPDKSEVRAAVLAARRALPAAAREAADALLTRHAAELVAGRTVCAYAPLPNEPGGPGFVAALVASASQVLLPVTLPDRDLDWVAAGNPGARLGPAVVAGVDLLLVPAVAVDLSGVRLGRGGGSYDRALARVAVGTPVVAVVYDPEYVPALPAEAHDRPVTAVLTPAGLRRIGPD